MDGVIARYSGRERLWAVERFLSQTDQDGDRIGSENACQKPAGNNRRLNDDDEIAYFTVR